MRILIPVLLLFFCSCKSQYYYIVRHAEKAVITKDSLMYSTANPPLSEAGKVRALTLKEELKNKHIGNIFSTNYARTLATAEPLANELKLPIQIYSASKDSVAAFVKKVISIPSNNVLIVGHSNTIDDLINAFLKQNKFPADLSDKIYEKMYIIKKKGNRMIYNETIYGYPSNPE